MKSRAELDREQRSRPGCLALQNSRTAKTLVGLYKAVEANLDDDGGPYVTICEPHGGCVNHLTLKDARAFLSHPEEWCPVCQGHDPAPEDSPKLTFDEWKAECNKVAGELLDLNVLEADDPYDLFMAMPDAHKAGQSPESFIREMFEDDLASREHDKVLARESEAYAAMEDEEEVEDDEGVEEEVI